MSDLKHWLDDASDADEFERSILRAGLDAEPPRGKEGEVWSSLVGALAMTPVLPAASMKAALGNASKATAVWLGVGKGFVLGLAIYGAAAGISDISERLGAPAKSAVAVSSRSGNPVSASQSSAARSAALPEAVAEPLVQEPAAAPSTVPSASSAPAYVPPATAVVTEAPPLPSVAAFPEAQGAARTSQLQAETAALRSARAALRAGNLTAAFATLEASQRQFAAPELYQEREALLIELLFRSGQPVAARQRAGAFLARFPESPHADSIRQLVGR